MSISVVNDLPFIAPTGNPMLLELQSNNMYSTTGSKSSLDFIFSGIDSTAGHVFSLSWGNIEIEFTLAAIPDDSGLQIRSAGVAEPQDDWMEKFAEDLMKNYYMNRDFDCAVDLANNKFTLEAKEKGTAFSMTVIANTVSNLTIYATEGIDQVSRDNFEILLRTYIFNGTSKSLLNEDRLSPDASGKALFDLHNLFAGQLQSEFFFPESSDTLYQIRSNHVKMYTLEYAELYESSVKRLTQYSRTVRATLGAFDYKMMAGLNDVSFGFLDFITTFKSFLTWQPIQKKVNKVQTEKLYFLVYDDVSELNLKVKVYYSDSTDSGKQNAITIDSVSKYDVFEFMVGYAILNVEQYSSKTVTKYEVWLEDDKEASFSHTRTFIVDQDHHRHERIFLFRNSFGAYDTFRSTGRKTHFNQYERMFLEKTYQDFTLKEQYNALENSVFTVNSGYISPKERNWLRELLLSKDAYEIINGYKFPILITDKKRPLFDDNINLHELSINYKYAFKDSDFSGEYSLQPLLAENLEILLNENGEWLFA